MAHPLQTPFHWFINVSSGLHVRIPAWLVSDLVAWLSAAYCTVLHSGRLCFSSPRRRYACYPIPCVWTASILAIAHPRVH